MHQCSRSGTGPIWGLSRTLGAPSEVNRLKLSAIVDPQNAVISRESSGDLTTNKGGSGGDFARPRRQIHCTALQSYPESLSDMHVQVEEEDSNAWGYVISGMVRVVGSRTRAA